MEHLLCFMHLVVHICDYIHFVRLPITHVSTNLCKPFHRFLDTYQKIICERHQTVYFWTGICKMKYQLFRSNVIAFLSSRDDI